MTTPKVQKTKEPQPEERDDLALDPEAVKDLEPREKAGVVRGGASGSGRGASS